MAITATTGPYVAFGQTLTSTGGIQEYNGQAGPSLYYQSAGILDPRAFYTYQPGSDVTQKVYGWTGGDMVVLDQVPTVISTNSVAQTQSSTTATSRTLTLTASNTNNVTVNQSVVAPETGQTVTGLWAIDGATSQVTFGSDGTISVWNPNTMVARCITFFSSQNDSGGAYTVSGRDVYGYLMNETVVGPNNTTVTTQKAFKYISTIVASGTIASTGIIVGVSDVYGFPLAVSAAPYAAIYISSGTSFGSVTSSTGITVASTRATQTSTTPDVRGTWSSTTASDGTRRFLIFITPSPAALGSTGLLGAAQYSTAS